MYPEPELPRGQRLLIALFVLVPVVFVALSLLSTILDILRS